MHIRLNDKPIAPDNVTVNDGLNYGRFPDNKPVMSYSFRLDRAELVSRFCKRFQDVLEEIRQDDGRFDDTSPFKSMGYVSLDEAFQYPDFLAEAIETYFDRDIMKAFLPTTQSYRYVINSTDRIVASDDAVQIDGRCLQIQG